MTLCGTFSQATQEPPGTTTEIALVEVDGCFDLVGLDGMPYHRDSKFWCKPHKLEFRPGDHEVQVQYSASTSGRGWSREEKSDVISVPLPDLKAGHRYRVTMKRKGSRIGTIFSEITPETRKRR
jgi:hypothetical protein